MVNPSFIQIVCNKKIIRFVSHMKNMYKKYYGTNKRYYEKRYHSTNILKRTNVNNGKVAMKWFQINIQKRCV